MTGDTLTRSLPISLTSTHSEKHHTILFLLDGQLAMEKFERLTTGWHGDSAGGDIADS